MAIKYTANVIRQIKSGATTYDLQDATLKPFVEQLLSDVASIKGVYTEEQANAYNAELDGALPNTGEAEFTAAQAEAYNAAITGAAVQEGDTITPEQANLYNATLTGAVEAGDELDDDSVTSVKTLSDDLTTLEGDVEEHARVTAAALTDLDSRIDAIEAVNVTTEKMAAWDAKYDKPGTGIPTSDLSSAVQTSLGLADTSVQSVAEGATNGTIAVDNTDVAVHGLGSAAFTDSTAYDAAGAASTVQSTLIGASGDAASANTIYGAKAAAAAVLGTSGDADTDNTVYGAKAYAKGLIDKVLGEDAASTTLATLKQVIQELNAPENQNGITGTFIDTVKADLAGLTKTVNDEQVHATVKEYVDNAVSNASSSASSAIQALDAEITSNDGTNVQVKVTEVDGVITAVNVTTDNTVNSTNVNTAITTAIEALDANPSQTAGAANGQLSLSLTQTDGVVTAISGSITANTYDAYGAASTVQSTLIGASGDADTANTIYGAKAYADAAINALDANPSQTAGAANGQLSLSLTQTDGAVTAISGSITANTYDAYGAASTVQSTLIGASGDAASANTIYGAKAAAAAVLGTSNDAAGTNTVYGVKALVGTVPQGYTNIIDYIDSKTSVDNGILTL